MSFLNKKQLKDYENHGFVAPIDVLTLEEATKIKEEIEYIEKKWPAELMNKEDIVICINANEEL